MRLNTQRPTKRPKPVAQIISPLKLINFFIPALRIPQPLQHFHEGRGPSLHLRLPSLTAIPPRKQPSRLGVQHTTVPLQHQIPMSFKLYQLQLGLCIPCYHSKSVRTPVKKLPPSRLERGSIGRVELRNDGFDWRVGVHRQIALFGL